VEYDVDRIVQVHPRAEGWIEHLYVRTEGERVERKDTLADYFSPSVLWAQSEYLKEEAASELSSFDVPANVSEPGSVRIARARQLLRYLNVPEMYTMTLKDTYQPREILPLMAHRGGIVTEIKAREGMFVTPGEALFTIVDLSAVWVMVDIYEHQIAWVRPGLSAEVTSPAYPGRTWEAKVDFVYPEVHPKARTLRARVEVRNPEEQLLPNMFVDVVIYGGPSHDVLIVPREALIVTGERETVIEADGDGRFTPVEVRTGMGHGEGVEVLSGLEEGDTVVVSGQFLIDSESNMQASLRRMMAD
jgi:Cu(I)/Ag(I) efflux system membrane fusion protein